MARPKKGQIKQFMVPARSSSDGSLITTMTASDFNSGAVCKWFGVNDGISDAFTSGTLSKAARLVSSGLMQITLNATENNYDEMIFRARKTSMKPIFAAWNNADYDDSDLMSRLSDLASDLRSYVVESRSQLSDVQSTLTIVNSRVLLTQSAASDAASAAQQGNSRVLLCQSRISDVQSFLSDFQSDLLSHLDTTGVGLNASTMSDVRSAINALTVTIGASDISDIASAVVAGLPVTSAVSDIYSMLSDLMSDFQSRVPKRVATDSQLSNLHSDLLSYLAGMSGVQSDIYSNLSDLKSDFQSRVPKAVATNSQLSDLASDLRSYLVAMSGALSDVESQLDLVPTANNSDAISNVYSLLALVASNVSDVESQIDAGIEIGASSMSDLRSAITANGMQKAGADPTGVVGVTDSYGAKLDWLAAMSRNELTQTASSAVLKNDGGTAVASAPVSDDGTTFTRGKWH